MKVTSSINTRIGVSLFSPIDAPLAPLNRETLYGGSDQGYTGYAILRSIEPHASFSEKEKDWR